MVSLAIWNHLSLWLPGSILARQVRTAIPWRSIWLSLEALLKSSNPSPHVDLLKLQKIYRNYIKVSPANDKCLPELLQLIFRPLNVKKIWAKIKQPAKLCRRLGFLRNIPRRGTHQKSLYIHNIIQVWVKNSSEVSQPEVVRFATNLFFVHFDTLKKSGLRDHLSGDDVVIFARQVYLCIFSQLYDFGLKKEPKKSHSRSNGQNMACKKWLLDINKPTKLNRFLNHESSWSKYMTTCMFQFNFSFEAQIAHVLMPFWSWWLLLRPPSTWK